MGSRYPTFALNGQLEILSQGVLLLLVDTKEMILLLVFSLVLACGAMTIQDYRGKIPHPVRSIHCKNLK